LLTTLLIRTGKRNIVPFPLLIEKAAGSWTFAKVTTYKSEVRIFVGPIQLIQPYLNLNHRMQSQTEPLTIDFYSGSDKYTSMSGKSIEINTSKTVHLSSSCHPQDIQFSFPLVVWPSFEAEFEILAASWLLP
jgi:hypothetical protein